MMEVKDPSNACLAVLVEFVIVRLSDRHVSRQN